jgi:queuosine precursor transporter
LLGQYRHALVSATITQWLFKTGYEILATPLTYVVVNLLKKQEGLDTHDRETNFSPLRLSG